MTTRRDVLKSAALLGVAVFPVAARSESAALASVPVAGHFTHDEVRIWVQATRKARGALEFWQASDDARRARTMSFELPGERPRCAIVELSGLAPGTRYHYRIALDGKAAGEPGVFRTAPAPASAPRDFRIYFGSCAYTETSTRGGSPYGDELHIFDTIAAQMGTDPLPHFMLWLGDNLYLRRASRSGAPADFASAELMEARYREVRAKPFLQKLFGATHHYAIWDDHDYGPDNSDRTFPLKDESLRLFRAYWPNPDLGTVSRPGAWSRFTHEDAEFFLLDGRWQRDPEKAPPSESKAMYGPEQMTWLKEGLRASKATFKLVAGGSQFLSENMNGVQSGWHSYPNERDDFLAFLAREKVPGVVLLSGDRHNTQVFRFDREGALPVYEVSSSPMTSRLIKLSEVDWANPRLVRECVVEQRNYGTLELSGSEGARRLTARSFDASGKLLWTQVLLSAA